VYVCMCVSSTIITYVCVYPQLRKRGGEGESDEREICRETDAEREREKHEQIMRYI
jgi:hypothetical protein